MILTSKEEINYTYMEGLLNHYNMLKELHKKISKSLCYYIEKNNTEKIKERRDELIESQNKLDKAEEGIISFYEECSGKKIDRRCTGFSVKDINKIKKFLDSILKKEWNTQD